MQFWARQHNTRMELDGTLYDVLNNLNNKPDNLLHGPKYKRDDGCYDEQFDPPPHDSYLCGICQKVPKVPMQAACGHLFCKRCTHNVSSERPLNCPIDKETSLSEDMIHEDHFERKEILDLKVHCHNYMTHGCQWLESLKDLPSHVMNCEFSVIRCPNNCGTELQRNELKDHVDEVCVRRIIACMYCDVKVVALRLTEHYEKCPLKTTACPYDCGGEFVWDELKIHFESKCHKMKRKCQSRKRNFQGMQIGIENITRCMNTATLND